MLTETFSNFSFVACGDIVAGHFGRHPRIRSAFKYGPLYSRPKTQEAIILSTEEPAHRRMLILSVTAKARGDHWP